MTATAKVLDVGAGSGLLGRKLAGKGTSLRMTGIDASQKFADILATLPEYEASRMVWMG